MYINWSKKGWRIYDRVSLEYGEPEENPRQYIDAEIRIPGPSSLVLQRNRDGRTTCGWIETREIEVVQ